MKIDITWQKPKITLVRAIENDIVMGYLYVEQRENCLFVFNLYVEPLHRRKGIATALNQKIFELFNSGYYFITQTSIGMSNVHIMDRFLKKLGFKKIGVCGIHYVYQKGIIMELEND